MTDEISSRFYHGMQVYAKVVGYPYWPARIDCIELSRYPYKDQDRIPKYNQDEIW